METTMRPGFREARPRTDDRHATERIRVRETGTSGERRELAAEGQRGLDPTPADAHVLHDQSTDPVLHCRCVGRYPLQHPAEILQTLCHTGRSRVIRRLLDPIHD